MSARRTFVVCEDGTEYVQRFRRFLGESFNFVPASDFAAARAALPGRSQRRASGTVTASPSR